MAELNGCPRKVGDEAWDAKIAGERHRITMAKSGFIFENTFEEY